MWKTLSSLIVAGGLSGILIMAPWGKAQADEPVPPAIQAVESGQLEALYAAQMQEGGGGPDLTAIYNELKKIAKEYRQARSQEDKSNYEARAEDLMGQIFDARVQGEQRRIQAMEQRLGEEKQRLNDMQRRKQDLVHEGVIKALDTGEMPDWADPKRAR